MKTKIFILLTTVVYLLISSFSILQVNNKGSLTFQLWNFENDNGKAIIHLFKKGDAVPKSPSWVSSAKIINGKATIVFKEIPYNEYAAILFQDQNSNGILDHSWGMPAEPMGFSNGWELSLFSGMPSFSKLKFEFSEQKNSYKINIK